MGRRWGLEEVVPTVAALEGAHAGPCYAVREQSGTLRHDTDGRSAGTQEPPLMKCQVGVPPVEHVTHCLSGVFLRRPRGLLS